MALLGLGRWPCGQMLFLLVIMIVCLGVGIGVDVGIDVGLGVGLANKQLLIIPQVECKLAFLIIMKLILQLVIIGKVHVIYVV